MFWIVLFAILCPLAFRFGYLLVQRNKLCLKSQDAEVKEERNLYAMLVTTNIVSQPCDCGWCRPEQGIRVPEHIGVIGYDLRIEVSTNYLPVVTLP